MSTNDKLDIVALPILKQSACVLQAFENGLTLKELVLLLEGEDSLANAYLLFFKQMGCIKEQENRCFLTEKGRATIDRLTGTAEK